MEYIGDIRKLFKEIKRLPFVVEDINIQWGKIIYGMKLGHIEDMIEI